MVQSINGSNLKIVLTADEMVRLFGSGIIDIKNEKIGKIMDKILSHAAKTLDFQPLSGKIIVEIFKKKNGAGIIYFLDVCKNLRKEAVLEFSSVDDLITAAQLLKNTDFSLYTYKGVYRIIAKLDNCAEQAIKRMCEFPKIYFEREQVARTAEYGIKKA